MNHISILNIELYQNHISIYTEFPKFLYIIAIEGREKGFTQGANGLWRHCLQWCIPWLLKAQNQK